MVSLTYTVPLSPSHIHHFSAWSYRHKTRRYLALGVIKADPATAACFVKYAGCQVNRSDLGNG